jgi:hypothetical protein
MNKYASEVTNSIKLDVVEGEWWMRRVTRRSM